MSVDNPGTYEVLKGSECTAKFNYASEAAE